MRKKYKLFRELRVGIKMQENFTDEIVESIPEDDHPGDRSDSLRIRIARANWKRMIVDADAVSLQIWEFVIFV